MIYFYALPLSARIVLSMFSVACVMSCAIMVALRFLRFRQNRLYWIEGLLVALILCDAFIYTASLSRAQNNAWAGYGVYNGYSPIRYLLFAAVTVSALFLFSKKERLIPCFALFISCANLPVVETLTGRAFPYLLALALAILLTGSIWISMKTRLELRSYISGLSIKQAMDSLNAAVMYYREDGHVLLQNNKMRELTLKTGGSVFYDGKQYLESVIIARARRYDADSYLYELPEESWLFTQKEIRVKKMKATQVTAIDVTDLNRANLLLREAQAELKDRHQKLVSSIANIDKICRAQEMLRIKNEIHDAQNRKLTLLLQYLRYGELPHGETLAAIKEGVLRGSGEDAAVQVNPHAMLGTVIEQYERIGVKTIIQGALPDERETARVFAQAIQEALANSVKHGYANRVYVRFTDDGHWITMRVTDNSTLPPREVVAGGGFSDIRLNAERAGGTMTAAYEPATGWVDMPGMPESADQGPGVATRYGNRFTLTVTLPRKEALERE